MIKITELFSSLHRHTQYGARLNPMRDWLALIALSAIALAGVIVWNAWTFDTVASGGVIGARTVSAPSTFNEKSLETIQSIFANRATEKGKYEDGTYYFADPSQ